MEHSKRVLIVEDEAILAFTLKRILESAGHDVIGTTAYGEAAVESAVSGRPDIVLMDIFLKGEMNGIEAATLINEKVNASIIFITGNSDAATHEQAMRTGPAAYIQKPVQKKEILEAMRLAIGETTPEQVINDSVKDENRDSKYPQRQLEAGPDSTGPEGV